jgi:hypothetical protein
LSGIALIELRVRSPGVAEGWCGDGVDLFGGIALIELSVRSPGVAGEWYGNGMELIWWYCTN